MGLQLHRGAPLPRHVRAGWCRLFCVLPPVLPRRGGRRALSVTPAADRRQHRQGDRSRPSVRVIAKAVQSETRLFMLNG